MSGSRRRTTSRIVTPDMRCSRGADHPMVSSGRWRDGFADKELLLLQHHIGIPAEAREVASTLTQWEEIGQQRRPSHPEVLVCRPPIQNWRRPTQRLKQQPCLRREVVEQCPASALTQQAFEQGQVRAAQNITPERNDLDRRHPPLVDRLLPQGADQTRDSGSLLDRRVNEEVLHCATYDRHGHAEMLEITLQIRFLTDGALGRTEILQTSTQVLCQLAVVHPHARSDRPDQLEAV